MVWSLWKAWSVPGANTRGSWDTDCLLPSPTPPLGRVDFRRHSGGTWVGSSWYMGLYMRFKPKDWSARITLKLSYISVSTNQHVTSILAAHFCTIMENKYQVGCRRLVQLDLSGHQAALLELHPTITTQDHPIMYKA